MNYILIAIFASFVSSQYVPERYGWSCYNVAASRNWPQCANVAKSQRKQCLCQIPEFIAMTENCLIEAVKNETDPEAAIEFARSQSLCRVDINSIVKIREDVGGNFHKVTVNGKQHEISPIKKIELRNAIKTADWRILNDKISENAGAGLLGFWCALIILRYISHLFTLFAPTKLLAALSTLKPVRLFRARILNAPLIRKHHSEEIKYLGVKLPTRSFTISILLYIVLNYCLTFTHYPYEPNNFMFKNKKQQWNKALAIRSSFMIMWKLPLLFCFSSRNNVFLLMGHPWAMETFTTFHRWLARITIIDMIIHGIAISVVKADQGIYDYMWSVPYWRWGVAGAAIACCMLVLSVRFITRRYYEAFKVLHIIMAVVFLVCIWYHVKILPYGTKHLYAIFAIWAFDYFARFLRLLTSCKTTARIEHVNSSLSLLKLNGPQVYGYAMRKEARYIFLHLSSPWYKLFQSHPFTIIRDWQQTNNSVYNSMDASKENIYVTDLSKDSDTTIDSTPAQNNFVLAIQHKSGITENISQMEGKVKVFLDGPYGHYFPLSRFRKVVFIAGGIGITAHLSHIQLLLSKPFEYPLNLKLNWAIKDLNELSVLLDAVATLSHQVEVTVNCLDVSAARKWNKYPIRFENARMDITETVKKEVLDSDSCDYHCSTAVFACGSNSLNDDARVAACWAIENARSYVEYYEETF